MNRVVGILLAVIVIVGIVVVMSATFIVRPTEQAIVLQFGDPRGLITDPGLHFKVPFIQDVIFFEKRLLDFDNPAEEVIAADRKRLVVDAYARYHIDDPLKYYRTVRTEPALRQRLGSVLNANLRRVLGTVPLQDVVSEKRSDLMGQIRDSVRDEMESFGIRVEDVRIKRGDLPSENSQKVFERMQTERQQQAAELRAQGGEEAQKIRAAADKDVTVTLAEADRDSQILRGEGEAEKNRLFAEAFGRDPEFFAFYRSMQAYQEALSGDDTTLVLSPNSDFFRFFGSVGGAALRP